MDAEEVLKLFDYYWFDHEIFTKQAPSSSASSINPVLQTLNEAFQPEITRLPTLIVRSLSCDQSSFTSDSFSPNSVLNTPKLQTIYSGKVSGDFTGEITGHEQGMIKERGKGKSKSLSELEFEELKGFRDLGFVFSEEDKDSRLSSIIPGLQRMGKNGDEDEIVDESSISRPYLSEAWAVLARRKKENPLMDWRVPGFDNEIVMKDHLKSWAHTVASTVR